MMNWKQRRELSYLLNEFDDKNLPFEIVKNNDKELIKTIIKFFNEGSELVYPAKSYFVAIIYAHYLNKFFNEDFYKALDLPDLLPDCPYYIPYSKSKNVYDEVIKQLGDIEQYSSIQKTLSYFKQEFLLEG